MVIGKSSATREDRLMGVLKVVSAMILILSLSPTCLLAKKMGLSEAGGSPMIIYEVNLTVKRTVATSFYDWLKPHMAEVVHLGKFENAVLYKRDHADEGSADDNTTVLWTVQYRVKDRDTLEVYLRQHAPSLREEGKRRFGDQFTATRRILEAVS